MEKSNVDEWTNCKACKKRIKTKSIITHLSRITKCRDVYGLEFDDMKAERDLLRKEYLVGYKKDYNKTNVDKIRKKQAKYDSEKKKMQLQNKKQSKVVSQELADNEENVDDSISTSPGTYYIY